MRLSALSGAWLCAATALAAIESLTIPAVIKVGEDFVANYTYPLAQPRHHAIVWGVGPAAAKPGEVGGYNHVGVTNLESDDVSGSVYYYQIVKGLNIPFNTYGQGGLLVIQAVLVGYVGAAGNTVFETRYFRVNTTLTGTTSNDQHVSDVLENRRKLTWPTE